MVAVKAHIARDDLGSVVKVWLFRDELEGRVYMWPVGYEGSSKAMSWYQEIVAHGQSLPDTIRPALEMSRPIWDAFKEALLADVHMRVDVLDIIADTLKREQTRVDVLINAVINQAHPVYMGELKDGG